MVNIKKKLRTFQYNYSAGPLPKKLLDLPISEGNCRLALQDYFYTVHGKYLSSKEILLPQAFRSTGSFVDMGDIKNLLDLHQGDIIYTENLKNKEEKYIYKDKSLFSNEDEWILHFHTAVYLGKLNKEILSFLPLPTEYILGTPVIWHASLIADGTAVWPVDKFLYYYRPIAVKRLSRSL